MTGLAQTIVTTLDRSTAIDRKERLARVELASSCRENDRLRKWSWSMMSSAAAGLLGIMVLGVLVIGSLSFIHSQVVAVLSGVQ